MTGLELPDSPAARAQDCACRIFPSAMRNLAPILAQMDAHAPKTGRALEIASGTGQQVVRFAGIRPYLDWQPSDLSEANRASAAAWRAASGAPNIREPIALDAGRAGWGADLGPFDLIVSVNLLHLVPDETAAIMLDEIPRALAPGGVALLYGPFLRGGEPTSAGDRRFHESLRAQDARLGYKDADWVLRQLTEGGLAVKSPIAMPANNLMFVCKAPA